MSDNYCYVVLQNTDLTEGRGIERPIGWFESEWDALEFAKGKGVMGSDAHVHPFEPSKNGSIASGPVYIQPASKKGRNRDELNQRHKEALDTYARKMKDHIARLEAKQAWLNSYLANNMEGIGKNKITCQFFTISRREGTFKTVVDDEKAIPVKYMREKITITPDKKAIGEQLRKARATKAASINRTSIINNTELHIKQVIIGLESLMRDRRAPMRGYGQMKLDPNKPITCEAAEDAVVVGPCGMCNEFLIYSRIFKQSWRVDSQGKCSSDRPKEYDVRNVPEKTNEHWIAHYNDGNAGCPYKNEDTCRDYHPHAVWYTHHWLENGEPKCEIVKLEKGK